MIVIAVSGKLRHGKDTVANFAVEALNSNGCTAVIRKFADPLKEEAAAFLADHTHGDVMNLLQAYAPSKAKAIYRELFHFKPTNWWERLLWWVGYRPTRTYLVDPTACEWWVDGEGVQYDYDDARDKLVKLILNAMHSDGPAKEVFRGWMQFWGTEYRREGTSPTYWTDQLKRFCDTWALLGIEYVLVPDTRFPNELDFIRSLPRGKGWRVFNPRIPVEENPHVSETALDDISDWDWVFDNDSSLDELRVKVYDAVKALLADFPYLTASDDEIEIGRMEGEGGPPN